MSQVFMLKLIQCTVCVCMYVFFRFANIFTVVEKQHQPNKKNNDSTDEVFMLIRNKKNKLDFHEYPIQDCNGSVRDQI